MDSSIFPRYRSPAMRSLQPSVAKGLIQLLCAFVLFAQQAALTHGVWHAAASQSAHEPHGGAHGDERTPATELSSLCVFDAAFGQVLGGAPATHQSACAETTASQRALYHGRAYTAADALTPRSRGPPALL